MMIAACVLRVVQRAREESGEWQFYATLFTLCLLPAYGRALLWSIVDGSAHIRFSCFYFATAALNVQVIVFIYKFRNLRMRMAV